MPLAEMERLFQDGLLGSSREILSHVNGNAREDAGAMFGVYRNAYWARLVESLAVDFPGLQALAGDAAFDRLARAYVDRHPSTTRSIRWAGRLLPQFLAHEAPYREDPWLADMARFDWALAHAFDAADAPVIGVGQLAAIPPELWGGVTLVLHPTLDFFVVSTPVDVVRPLLLADPQAACDRNQRRDGGLMVWRIGYDLKFRAIDPLELEALAAAQAGASFGDICETVASRVDTAAAAMRAAAFLRGWLEWGIVQDIGHDAPGSA